MKQMKQIAEAANFTAVEVGKLSELSDHVLELGPDVKVPGKVFGGTAVHATGGEFSFQLFQPGLRPVSCIRTSSMRSSTSSSAEKGNFRWTDRCSP